MSREDVERKFKQIQGNSMYIRATADHPLELYIGKNENGYPTLRFNGKFKHKKVIDSNVLQIKQFKNEDISSILFSYVADENISIFYNFCDDMIAQTEKYAGEDGYRELINRYEQWRKMFRSNSKLLDEKQVMGLIGELLFLKDYSFKIYGFTNALKGWSGPEPTHKDFSYDNEWFEIKTTNSGSKSVSISSLDQLDSEFEGRLIVYRLEKMSPSFDGITLNKLVSTIMNELEYDVDKNLFIEKLKQVGYCYNDFYDNYCYNLVVVDKYIVNDDFPRIKSDNLPDAIAKVNYEILLALIEKYKEE